MRFEFTIIYSLYCDNLEYLLTFPNNHLQCYSQSHWPHGSWPFHNMTSTIPSFHHSVPEAVNDGTVSGDHSCWQHFMEWPVTKKPVAL